MIPFYHACRKIARCPQLIRKRRLRVYRDQRNIRCVLSHAARHYAMQKTAAAQA
jgi:hypothetical protein